LQKVSHNTPTDCLNHNVRRINGNVCLLRILLGFGILSLLTHLPHSTFAQSPDPLLQKLDSHYYYPSQLGLKKLTTKVRWLQKDLIASQPKFIPHPEVLFSWDVESDVRVFQVVTDRKGLSRTQREEVEGFFQNYREVILPRRLNQILSGFRQNQAHRSFFQTTVEYHSRQKQSEIQKYSLNINSEHWRISQINLERKNPPYKVASDFKYIQREGKWLVSETLARFDLGKDSYSEKTSYTYQKIMGFWLPVKMNQVFKKATHVLHSYRFLFSDHKIN
jgi:hypothetical protein